MLKVLIANKIIKNKIVRINDKNYWKLIQLGKSLQLNISPDIINLLFNFLLHTGYLTIDTQKRETGYFNLKIPNKEIRLELSEKMIDYYQQISSEFPNAIEALKNVILNDLTTTEDKLKHFTTSFEKLLKCNDFPKLIDIKNDNLNGFHANEDSFH